MANSYCRCTDSWLQDLQGGLLTVLKTVEEWGEDLAPVFVPRCSCGARTRACRLDIEMALHNTHTGSTLIRLLCARASRIGYRAYQALQADVHGEPAEVLQLRNLELPKLREGEVVVNILGAPINPSDINQIQGVQKAVFKLEDLWRVPSGISIEAAATMSINPVTALCLLEDFLKLVPGDVVVQNGAGGSVGQFVIQVAHAMGLTTINVVRDRPPEAFKKLGEELGALGAHYVVPESVIQDKPKRRELLKSTLLAGRPMRLALNCVGGESAAALAACLGPDAKLVTYGAMGRSPVHIPPAKQIFQGLSSHGFWVSGKTDVARKSDALQKVAWLYQVGALQSRVIALPLKDYKKAMHSWGRDQEGQKFMFSFA